MASGLMKNVPRISVVIPAYNEEKSIRLIYKKLTHILQKMRLSYEIIFVDDGSDDGTFANITQIGKKDKHVHAIRFSKNFQKAAALSAGFSYARGNIILTMDADLQDDPLEIPKFIKMIDEGNDIVVGWRVNRVDSFEKIFASRIFNFLVRTCTNIKIHDSDCNF
ncbi:MAG: glycosyltransferase, partial [Nanoarchaeota archaeon]